MISRATAILTTALSLLGSAPISVLESDSPYDPKSTNVYYDLAVLYGDTDKDGAVSDEEYLSFDIDSLAPAGKVGENTSYKYLATMPYYVNELYLYLYSASRIDDCVFNDYGHVDYSSCTYSYLLDYQNSSTQNEVTGEWIDDTLKSTSLDLVNYYHSPKGYFYKFTIENYNAIRSEDNTYRFKPRNLRVLTESGVSKLTCDFGNGDEYQFLYDENCHDDSAPYIFFSEKTYELDAVADLFLASTNGKVEHDTLFSFIPVNESLDVYLASEVFCVFFNFKDDSFHPDEIKSVTYRANVNEYKVVQYQHRDNSSISVDHVVRDIYRGTKFSFSPETISFDFWGDTYSYTSSLENVNSHSIKGTTIAEDHTVFEIFECDTWWDHMPQIRTYNWKSISSLDDVRSADFPNDESWKPWKDFVLADDHNTYDYVYSISSDDFIRSVSEPELVLAKGSPSTEIHQVFKRESICHDLSEIVTLGMTVVQEDKEFSIRTIHNPLTTRKVYCIGAKAPSLSDFLVNDISNFFQQYWWAVLIVALVALAILGMIFNPVFSILKFIFNAVLFVIKLVIEVLYFLLVWWWLALIKKAKGEDVPKLWLFK